MALSPANEEKVAMLSKELTNSVILEMVGLGIIMAVAGYYWGAEGMTVAFLIFFALLAVVCGIVKAVRATG